MLLCDLDGEKTSDKLDLVDLMPDGVQLSTMVYVGLKMVLNAL